MIGAKIPYGDPTDAHLQALEQLKKLLAAKGREYFETLDDVVLLAFLRARLFDTEKTVALIENYHNFSEKYLPTKPLSLGDVVAGGVMTPKLIHPRTADKAGRSIFVLRARLHETNLPIDEQMKLLWYTVEHSAMTNISTQMNGTTLIFDMSELNWAWSRRNVDGKGKWIASSVELLNATLNCCPVRIERVIITRMNMMFPPLWQLLAPFLWKEFRDIVKMVKNPDDLTELIAPDQLLEDFGGTARYDHDLHIAALRQEEEASVMSRVSSCGEFFQCLSRQTSHQDLVQVQASHQDLAQAVKILTEHEEYKSSLSNRWVGLGAMGW